MKITMKSFLWRGLAAGAIAGLVWGLYLRFVLETQIGFALQFEDAAGLGAPAGDDALFSRATQQAGGMAGALLYGLVLGIILAVTVAALHHRIAAHNEFGRAARVAAGIFVAMILIPMLKYPPNPPTVGDPDTASQRTSDFLLLMGASVVVVFVAFFAWQWFTDRGHEGAVRFLAVIGGLGLIVVALYAIWPPSPDAVAHPTTRRPRPSSSRLTHHRLCLIRCWHRPRSTATNPCATPMTQPEHSISPRSSVERSSLAYPLP